MPELSCLASEDAGCVLVSERLLFRSPDAAPALLDLAAAQIPSLASGAEPRWTALRRLAAAGQADDARIDAELAADPSDTGRRSAAACRAEIPDAAHKEAAWRLADARRPHAGATRQRAVPVPGRDPRVPHRIDRFLSTGAADPGLARVVRDHRDTAGRVLRARTA